MNLQLSLVLSDHLHGFELVCFAAVRWVNWCWVVQGTQDKEAPMGIPDEM